MIKYINCLFALVCFSSPMGCFGKNLVVNPVGYGLLDAKSDAERFCVLKRCHEDAVQKNMEVSYAGIDSITIEIPNGATAIPLSYNTDFCGTKIIVRNNYKHFVLFYLISKVKEVEIDSVSIDSGNFQFCPSLRSGKKMLIIRDENPWITERIGYEQECIRYRQDILLLTNGKATNKVVQPYNNKFSKPSAFYCEVPSYESIIQNIHFVRSSSSSFITHLFNLRNQCGVKIKNINVETPQGKITSGDGCMIIENCANVYLDDICINGTYSDTFKTGYGMRLLNVYNVIINKMQTHCKWGVFGNYDVNKVILRDCDINRFDVHNYGKDIRFKRCKFSNCYNQFSSVYGDVSFEKCTFENQTPFLQESTFNAFTPFNLRFLSCDFYLNKRRNYIITLYGVPEKINERPELSRKSLPNIIMKDCEVTLDDNVDNWYLIETRGVKYKDNFDYIANITLRKVRVSGNASAKFSVSTEELRTTNQVKKTIDIRYDYK